jgi:type II secretory pathway pseudopilin PulG
MRLQTELAQTIPSQNPEVNAMASVGRGGDTMIAHVTPGDYVIPKDILVQHPDFLVKLKKVMSDENQDYRTHMVGSGFENINPETGSPEFFFGKIKKKLGGFAGGIGQAVGNLTGSNALGRAASIATGGALGGGSPLAISPASSGYSDIQRQQTQASNNANLANLYNQGYRSGENVSNMALPQSLQELGGLTDTQRRSYLSSQGAQGEGLGGSSRDYYINLLQRNIQSNPNQELLPVESQYLRQGGLDTNLTGQALINALRGF